MKRKYEIGYMPVYWLPLKGKALYTHEGTRMPVEDASGLPVPSTWDVQVTAGGKVLRRGRMIIEKHVPHTELYKPDFPTGPFEVGEEPLVLGKPIYYSSHRIMGNIFGTPFTGDWVGVSSSIDLWFVEKSSEYTLRYSGNLERDESGKVIIRGDINAKGLPVPLQWKATLL